MNTPESILVIMHFFGDFKFYKINDPTPEQQKQLFALNGINVNDDPTTDDQFSTACAIDERKYEGLVEIACSEISSPFDAAVFFEW